MAEAKWMQFERLEQLDSYVEALEAYGKLTFTPTVAAFVLGCTRSAIYKLLESGRLRAWSWSESGEVRADVQIAAEDVRAWRDRRAAGLERQLERMRKRG